MAMTRRTPLVAMTAFAAVPGLDFGAGGGSGGSAAAEPLRIAGIGAGWTVQCGQQDIGEIGLAAAIANAVHHATGKRIRSLPITKEK